MWYKVRNEMIFDIKWIFWGFQILTVGIHYEVTPRCSND